MDCIGTSFVDDADLYAWLPALKTSAEVWQEMQSSVNEWGGLLISTGGALKPEKCYWYNIGYKFLCDGSWVYEDNTQKTLTVPLPDGSRAAIQHLPVTEHEKMLGVYSCP